MKGKLYVHVSNNENMDKNFSTRAYFVVYNIMSMIKNYNVNNIKIQILYYCFTLQYTIKQSTMYLT